MTLRYEHVLVPHVPAPYDTISHEYPVLYRNDWLSYRQLYRRCTDIGTIYEQTCQYCVYSNTPRRWRTIHEKHLLDGTLSLTTKTQSINTILRLIRSALKRFQRQCVGDVPKTETKHNTKRFSPEALSAATCGWRPEIETDTLICNMLSPEHCLRQHVRGNLL